ncbi:MAG TPA: hypothetical protein VKU02_17690, partial [Gemmataceae bacterium]|nr:hypothetical protein [Gemmataceae bacterium]
MSAGKFSSVAILIVIATLIGGVTPGLGQTGPPAIPSDHAVATLIGQLGAADFRTREQASNELEKLGSPVLRLLRKATAKNTELEVKRRIERVISRIETRLLKAEEKQWPDLETFQGTKDRLIKILGRTPGLSDRQVVSVIYLLTVGRPPTNDEAVRANRQLTEFDNRLIHALRLMRSLMQSREFKTDLAQCNVRLLKMQRELLATTDVAKQLARLNAGECQKLLDATAASLAKTAKTDAQLVDMAFLLALSRLPEAKDSA